MDELNDLLEELKKRGMIPSEMSFDPKSWEQVKVDSYNKSEGTLKDYNCPKCKNRGNFMFLQENGNHSFRDCDCLKIRRSIARMKDSGLERQIQDLTFEKFQATEGWQKTVLKTAQDYADNPVGWILLCGQPGCGKTHLCTAVCRKLLLDGREVCYIPWREESAKIKGMDGERRENAVRKLQQVDVLYLDDLFKMGQAADGSTRPTAADIGLAYEILNARYNNKLPTILSTEKSMGELLDIDEALGSRIKEMSQEHNAVIAKKAGRNYRLRGIAEI